VEDPELLKRVVDAQVALEVCPASNVSLGVYRRPEDVPLRKLYEAGARIALGADDPLLFGSRLAEQYETARSVHNFTDPELADLARGSVLASTAPADVQKSLLADIDSWLGVPETATAATPVPTY
jgi:adenosine deaminase